MSSTRLSTPSSPQGFAGVQKVISHFAWDITTNDVANVIDVTEYAATLRMQDQYQ